MKKDLSIYKERRDKLAIKIKQKYPDKKGTVLFFADFENVRTKFRQDSYLYYFSGLEEPGIVLAANLENAKTYLYMPQYSESRAKWSKSILYESNEEFLKSSGIDELKVLGNVCKGYSISPLCSLNEYEYLVQDLKKLVSNGENVFLVYSGAQGIQKILIDRLISMVPDLNSKIIDISDMAADLRRTKSKEEIELIYNAVDCTMSAQEAAAQIIDANKMEFEIEAGIEFIYIQSGARSAFPSIVASGKNATILHYNLNDSLMKKGDLVIVDIGAEFEYYCADITRTYPVSGVFTKRQKELYNIVLETQEYIENLVKPGYWLNNKNEPEKSLHHLAYSFLDKMGYAKYFTHSIGHFLGLDVHDVGNINEPLKEGDVITIEPGIYIPEENLGIRLEDNYWILKDGLICLSQDLPKEPNLIEEIMAQSESSDED